MDRIYTHSVDRIYTQNEIFRYEDISKAYINLEGRLLSPRELIERADKEERFDVDYATYIAYKNKIQIEEFIMKRNLCIANSLQFIRDDYWVEDEDEFDPKINAMQFRIKPTVFDILEVLLRDKQWDLVFYVYYRETAGLNSLIAHLEDEHTTLTNILDKKMLIIKPKTNSRN